MKKIGVFLAVLVLLFSGCNAKKENEQILIVDGEEMPIDDLLDSDDILDSVDELLENDIFDIDESEPEEQPALTDTSELSADEYRIRSVFEGMMFTIEDPGKGEHILSDDAVMCFVYDNFILIQNYNKPIENYNSSSLAEEIGEISEINLDYCYVPEHKSTVEMLLYGTIDEKKYSMLSGYITPSQNEDIGWWAVEANNGTSAEEVAVLYTEMDNMQLVSHVTDEKTIHYFSGQEGWFLPTNLGVDEFSTMYLWDYEGAVCAIVVQGEHEAEYFDYCDFAGKSI